MLNEIAHEIGMVLRDAGLIFLIFIIVPTSGNTLATIATPPCDPGEDR
jgi:hypothetical protein